MRTIVFTLLAALVLAASSTALAQDEAPAPAVTTVDAGDSDSYPRLGGHLGLAVPLVTFADPVTGIGADYTRLGLVVGVNFAITERLSIDLEFVAYSDFWGATTISNLVVDPGVIYAFDFLSVGLRTAVHVVQPQNWGFIPIIVKAFPITDVVKIYVELDFPIFINEQGIAMTIQPQAGIAF